MVRLIADRSEKSVFWLYRIVIASWHKWRTFSRVCGTTGLIGSSITGFGILSTCDPSAEIIIRKSLKLVYAFWVIMLKILHKWIISYNMWLSHLFKDYLNHWLVDFSGDPHSNVIIISFQFSLELIRSNIFAPGIIRRAPYLTPIVLMNREVQ